MLGQSEFKKIFKHFNEMDAQFILNYFLNNRHALFPSAEVKYEL